ncbi:30S ribosomal protein S17 [Candidatus Daviesbacteria bacterium RIFCSPLOWO2_01_FULL_40_27]|nr:MAG: 30S ribosomal protein S17 [Candidatus Daviesbacteria bacterium RIFCSPLOWO2_01_FULL_40_27]
MIGRVVSTKTEDTATVLVERVAKHPLYKKTFIRTKKYLVDTKIPIKEGDMVEIVKVRPISKNKHWRILKVMGKDLEAITKEKLKAEAEEAIAEVMPESPEESTDQNVSESEEKTFEGKKKEVVMDNSIKKPKSRKKGKTELSKK